MAPAASGSEGKERLDTGVLQAASLTFVNDFSQESDDLLLFVLIYDRIRIMIIEPVTTRFSRWGPTPPVLTAVVDIFPLRSLSPFH